MTVIVELLESAVPVRPARRAWIQYTAGLIVFTGVLLIFLAMIHVRGGFFHPAWFPLFRRLFYLQYALFGGALLATLLYLAPRRLGWFGRAILFAPFHFGCCWLALWCLVHRTFGIELTPGTLFAVLTNQAPIATMGVNATELGWTLSLSAVVVAALTTLTEFAYRRYDQPIRRRLCWIAVLAFLVVHVPTRTYFAYQIARNVQVVLAFDDCVPFPLRTERLIAGLHHPRISLPNYESPNATEKYLKQIQAAVMPVIPRPRNILWINVESLIQRM